MTAADTAQADVLIDGEEIVAVGALGDVDAEVIDADGCYVLPGLIDNHTHMAMPFGGTHSNDDYDTGTRAAAAGGTTCIVDFVIQQHPDGLRSSLDEWQERATGAAHVDYGSMSANAHAGCAFASGAVVDGAAPVARSCHSSSEERSPSGCCWITKSTMQVVPPAAAARVPVS